MIVQTLAAFLSLAVGPLAKKILAALGIGWLTYEGLALIGNQVQSAVLANWGAMPASMLQVLTLSGFTEAVGITLGAFTARIALTSFGRLGKISA